MSRSELRQLSLRVRNESRSLLRLVQNGLADEVISNDQLQKIIAKLRKNCNYWATNPKDSIMFILSKYEKFRKEVESIISENIEKGKELRFIFAGAGLLKTEDTPANTSATDSGRRGNGDSSQDTSQQITSESPDPDDYIFFRVPDLFVERTTKIGCGSTAEFSGSGFQLCAPGELPNLAVAADYINSSGLFFDLFSAVSAPSSGEPVCSTPASTQVVELCTRPNSPLPESQGRKLRRKKLSSYVSGWYGVEGALGQTAKAEKLARKMNYEIRQYRITRASKTEPDCAAVAC